MSAGDIVDEVARRRDEFADYAYLGQYEPDADGMRFNDEIAWDRPREVYGDEPIWGGIAGERDVREWLTTDLLDGDFSREHLERGLTREEFNDLQNYHGWNVYDTLALRATEGESEIIPRQEYEFLSFCWAMERWPEFFKLFIDTVGLDGIMELCRRSRTELTTGLTSLLGWVYIGVPGGGAIGMDVLDLVDPQDPVFARQSKVDLTMGAAVQYACLGEKGHLYSSQNRYALQTKAEETVEFVQDNLVDLEGTSKRNFRQFNAAAETLSFLMHYDNRVGLVDNGPYLVDDGKPLILRDILLNRPFLPWNDIAASRDLPHGLTVAMVVDPAEMGLQEVRVPLTAFTAPADYLSAVERGAVFLRNDRYEPGGYPLENLETADVDATLPDLTDRANGGITAWYKRTAGLPRRQKILNGAWTYYVGMLVPFLRATGTYDYFCEELDLWEMPPMTSDIYYRMTDGVEQEQVPAQIMFGYGWKDFPETYDEESGYADYLAEAREVGWKSQLSGMNPVPAGFEDRMDEHGLLDVPHTKMSGDVEPAELGDHLESL